MKQVKKLFAMAVLISFCLNGFSQAKSKYQDVEIKSSVLCGLCKERIEQNLPFNKGIQKVNVDLKTKTIKVKFNPKKTGPDKIKQAISKIGYSADEIPADPKAFNALPECCKDPNSSDHTKK